MRIETRPQDHPTATAAEAATLLVSFELSQSKWVLTIRVPGSAKLSRFTVPAPVTQRRCSSLLTTQREQAERRTGRPEVRIVSIYGGRAGRVLAVPAGWRRRGSRATWRSPFDPRPTCERPSSCHASGSNDRLSGGAHVVVPAHAGIHDFNFARRRKELMPVAVATGVDGFGMPPTP